LAKSRSLEYFFVTLTPVGDARPNTFAFETSALVKPAGFREYDAHCGDDVKNGVLDKVVSEFRRMKADGQMLAGQRIADLVTVNGVRVIAEDGTWGLVRASSNKPELVVVVESPVSADRRRQMFDAVDQVLRRNPEVGAYNQTF
jgi:phosphomannomutase / phosphoglucomutase